MTDFQGIEKIAEMFALSDVPASSDGKIVGGFQGFVVPPDYIHPYGKPALSLVARVTIAPNDTFMFTASVASIDDSGVSFFGPHETKEKAQKRLAMFRELIDEWHPLMPSTLEDLEKWGQRAGVHVDKW